MRTLFVKLLCLAPLPIALVLVNVIVDPVRLAGGDRYERSIADLLLAGHGATNITNPKDAVVVRYVVGGLSASPEVVMFGSSRSKLVRGWFFEGRSFYNNSVGGAGLVDFLALSDLYRQRGFTPKTVILEMSPWIVSPDYRSVWEDGYPPRAALEGRIIAGDVTPTWHAQQLRRALVRMRDLISPGYFQTSLFTWIQQARAGGGRDAVRAYAPTDAPVNETVLADGSTIYGERIWNATDRSQIRAQAISYADGPVAGIPARPDEGRLALLDAFVQSLRRGGSDVIFYFPPYHPTAYARLLESPRTASLSAIEAALRALAARRGIATLGAYDPARVALDETSFLDAVHPNSAAIARIFATRWKGRPPDAEAVTIAMVVNPNGVETRDGKRFFWMGRGATCFSIRAASDGWARLSLAVEPGPSIPNTGIRNYLVTAASAGFTKTLTQDGGGWLQVDVPVAAGLSDTCVQPLDAPTAGPFPSGDSRPLVAGVTEARVAMTQAPAAPAAPAEAAPCRVSFGEGWYAREEAGSDWHRWMSGRGQVTVTSSRAGTATLSAQALAATRPDHVDVVAGRERLGRFAVDWKDWEFRAVTPVRVPLRVGATSLTLVAGNPALRQASDPRSLAVAIRNLSIVLDGASVPCDVAR